MALIVVCVFVISDYASLKCGIEPADVVCIINKVCAEVRGTLRKQGKYP